MQRQGNIHADDRLRLLIGFGWAAAVTVLWMRWGDAWISPVQLWRSVAAGVQVWRFGPHFAEVWSGVLLNLLCVASILAAAFAAGAVTLQRWITERSLLSALFALAVGLWILAVLTLVIGFVSIRFVPLVFLMLGAWLWRAPRDLLRWKRAAEQPHDFWTRILLAMLLAAVLLNFLGAMTPPFEYDALEYHLGAPAEYQRAGRIVFLPHNFYSNMPQLTEMLFLLGLQTTGDVAAKLLHWAFGILSAVAIYAVAARVWDRRTGITAAALLYCVPFVLNLSHTARIDLATLFFGTLALGGMLVWRRENAEQWLRVGSVAAGLAVATKWTAVPVIVLPCFVLVCLAAFRGRQAADRPGFRLPAIFCALSIAVVVPWLIKNALLAGNPVYPLLNDWFGNPHWSPEQAVQFRADHGPRFGAAAVRDLWQLPWAYLFGEVWATPLLLITVPLLLLRRGADRNAWRAAGLFAAAVVGWYLLTYRPWRFLFPAAAMASIAGACAILGTGRGVRGLVAAVLALGLLVGARVIFLDMENFARMPAQVGMAPYALGQLSREEFVARISGRTFEPILWMNRNLPGDAGIAYIGEARPYYARHAVLWCTAYDRHPLAPALEQPATAEEMLAALRERGVTHLYVHRSEWERLRGKYGYLSRMNDAVFGEMLRDHARQVHANGGRSVWELQGAP